ncbi:hypothetical protein Sterm_0432 [Sebaldella termitidis ATCC 33386]|uniref:Uncharacterized protein n=1 Tax=Sebaldella termitidis (strain ATCC 33386 / NCTC 11300) TaxID=526218 RepID=D1AMT7_SEBTE|nr:hypothetical protein Sterm_0432 [Sebaldella termitidis ATCC 33386]
MEGGVIGDDGRFYSNKLNVEIVVIKIGSYATSGYPTGGIPVNLVRERFTPIIFE